MASASEETEAHIETSRRESLGRLESKLNEIYEKYSGSIPRDDETDVIDISTLKVIHSSGFLLSLPDAPSNLIGSIQAKKERTSAKKCYSAKSRSFRTILKQVEPDHRQKLLEKLEFVVIEKEYLPIEFIYALQSQNDSKYYELIDDLYTEYVEGKPPQPSKAFIRFFYDANSSPAQSELASTEELLEPICKSILFKCSYGLYAKFCHM